MNHAALIYVDPGKVNRIADELVLGLKNEKGDTLLDGDIAMGFSLLSGKFETLERDHCLVVAVSVGDHPKNLLENNETFIAFITHTEPLFILYHDTPAEAVLNQIVTTKRPQKSSFLQHSMEADGTLYHEVFKDLANLSMTPQNRFESVLRKLAVDYDLEAKLQLLHTCLTSDSANGVLTDYFRGPLKEARNRFWYKKLNELISTVDFQVNGYEDWTVEELVSALALKPKDGKSINFASDDLSCPNRSAAIALLRKALLGS